MTEVPPNVRDLAEKLMARHGSVRMAKEASGLHLYMASPQCLLDDGEKELHSKHLALNVDKALSGVRYCAQCMKSSKAYTLSELLRMKPISERGLIPEGTRAQIIDHTQDDRYIEYDGLGRLVPKPPGRAVPVLELSHDHPARIYLRHRGLNEVMLWQQFRVSFCEAARSDFLSFPMGMGLDTSPTGRIIFFFDQEKSTVGWQARIIEMPGDDGKHYLWHPKDNCWNAIGEYDASHKLQYFEGWDKAKIIKYLFSKGGNRNALLAGFDVAAEWSLQHRNHRGERIALVTEGVMDAAKFGPPAVATLGKYVSPEQCRRLATSFGKVIYVPDNDKVGAEATIKFQEAMAAAGAGDAARVMKLDASFEDAGDRNFKQEDALAMVRACLQIQ